MSLPRWFAARLLGGTRVPGPASPEAGYGQSMAAACGFFSFALSGGAEHLFSG